MAQLRSVWLLVILSLGLGGVLAFLPLVGLHGVESALWLGLILPPFVAAAAANTLLISTGPGTMERGVDLMGRGLLVAAVAWTPAVLLLAVNALRVRQCTPGEGFAYMVLGPGLGCALAGCVGVWCSALSRRAWWAYIPAFLIPVGSYLLGLWLFWSSPAIFVFNAFAGFFPGSIYDRALTLPAALLSYRAVTLTLIVSLIVLFDAVWIAGARRLQWTAALRKRPGSMVLALAGLSVVATGYALGEKAGHRSSAEYIVEKLGKTVEGAVCTVHVPRELPIAQVKRFVDDCDFQAALLSERLQVETGGRITAYLFRNGPEKQRLMGARKTLIAKPWRREIYLQQRGWPHRMLAHELAHVIAAAAAKGPFGVAGTLGGWLPNAGLIEGTAVALAWEPREELDPDQWSRVMLEDGKLPKARVLLSARFTTIRAARAYPAAGSVVRLLLRERGADGLKRAYAAGQVEQLDALDLAWQGHLKTVDLTDTQREIARATLDRPSIFRAVCPREVARLKEELAADFEADDFRAATESCREIIAIDRKDPHARVSLVRALASSDQIAEATGSLDAMTEARAAPKPLIAQATERVADAYWRQDDKKTARALYERALALPQTDGDARMVEAKLFGLDQPSDESVLIRRMLASPSPDRFVILHAAHQLAEQSRDGMGPYLIARQLVGRGLFEEALPLFQEAQRRKLPTERLRRENSRLLAMALYATGNIRASEKQWRIIATNLPTAQRAAQAEADLWLKRVRFQH